MSDQSPQLYEHHQANAIGVLDSRFDTHTPLVHFRGIKYASISQRFAAPALLQRDPNIQLRATEYGPRCPQPPVDVRDLMQIPKHLEQNPPDKEDEFECLNLNITMPKPRPKEASFSNKLPVMIWIHGGAQLVSFSTAAHRLCEPGPFVAQTISRNQSVILITINYRLNILAYGDGKPSSERNLQLQDLQTGVQWVFHHIAAFGGDTTRITIGGESAGAILTHALCLTLPKSLPIQNALLCSGSLGSSVPQPPSTFAPTVARLESAIRGIAAAAAAAESARNKNDISAIPPASKLTLKTCPIPILVKGMVISGFGAIPLQQHPSLALWDSPPAAFNRLDALMLGDCEFEGILWLAAIRLLSSSSSAMTIKKCFLGGPEQISTANQRLTESYSNSISASAGHEALGLDKDQAIALSFMADYLFHLPNQDIVDSLKTKTNNNNNNNNNNNKTDPSNFKQPKVYQYVFDEPNPFSTPPFATIPKGTGVPRAHHAVDLLALWANYDTDIPKESQFPVVGTRFRDKIIHFINKTNDSNNNSSSPESEPWNPSQIYAFGPSGHMGELVDQGDRESYGTRRRTEQFKVLREVGREVYDGVWKRLSEMSQAAVRRALEEAMVRQKRGGGGGSTNGDGKSKL